MKKNYVELNNLKISSELLKFVNDEVLKNTDISTKKFWSDFDKVVHELAPKNKSLLNKRQDLQKKIDNWHIKNKGKEFNLEEYKQFLLDIEYLKNEGSILK
tara:strand:- start:131 stop:433 length:303 start_codon:yes stop_codon:yes gene_type:complete